MSYDLAGANESYVATFNKGNLALPPSKKLLILTCMDARIDTGKAFGISEGDAHVVRNAGASAQDALRSIIISQRLLGTREIALVKHTNCGMVTFDNAELHGLLAQAHPEHAAQAGEIDFITLKEPIENGVREDVQWLKEHPLVLQETSISGWVIDVATGKVHKVV